jgi:hypothetical protein
VCVYVHNTVASNAYHFTCVSNVDPLFELIWIRVCASNMPEFVLDVCYHPPKPKFKTSDHVTTILKDIDAIFMQNPDAVIALAGDFDSLNNESILTLLLMTVVWLCLRIQSLVASISWITFFIFGSNSGFMH